MIEILLVDDEPLLLESLEIVLTIKGGFSVCGTAGNGVEALNLLTGHQPDVMLIDLNMPGMGGIELIKKVKETYPNIRMIVLTTFYDEKNIQAALANGASGYLLKDSGKDAIIEAVEQSVKGVSVLDAKVMQKLTGILNSAASDGTGKEGPGNKTLGSSVSSDYVNQNRPGEIGIRKDNKEDAETRMQKAGLTEREKEIARLIAEGCTNAQIASLLFISEGTVKNYVSVIYDKFDIKDRAKLAVFLKG